MSAVIIRFTCGHVITIDQPMDAWPVCHCGETLIAHVAAPPPTIRGTASGPLVTEDEE